MMIFPNILLRHQLAWLRARYDDGAIPPGIFTTIKEIETEIAWHDHRASINPRSRTDITAHRKGERRYGHIT